MREPGLRCATARGDARLAAWPLRRGHRGLEAEVNSERRLEALVAHWPDERVPAVGNRTPRVAARSRRWRPLLEALLREFEHDASLLERRGAPPPDIDQTRAELGDGALVGAA